VLCSEIGFDITELRVDITNVPKYVPVDPIGGNDQNRKLGTASIEPCRTWSFKVPERPKTSDKYLLFPGLLISASRYLRRRNLSVTKDEARSAHRVLVASISRCSG
jgi:hypothetical protein